MNATEVGLLIGELLLHTTRTQIDEVLSVVQKDEDSTRIHLPIAVAWVAEIKVLHTVPKADAPQMVRAISTRIAQYLADSKGLPLQAAWDLMVNRFEGYDAAATSSTEGIAWNVAKFFMASCQDIRPRLSYDEIIPDPDELALVPEHVDREGLAAIKEAKSKGFPTYRLDPLGISRLAACLFSIVAGVESVLQEHR